MIDKTIPHMGVLLEKYDTKVYPRYELPEGYCFEAFRPDREVDWVRIQASSELIENEEAAWEVFDKNFAPYQQELTRRMWFVTDPQGCAVATISLWRGGVFGPDRQRLHWVAVQADQQGKGLANAMMTRVLDLYQELGDEGPLFVASQTWSYAAVRMYEKFGFQPYMGPRPAVWSSEGDFEEEAREAWALIRQMQKH